VQALALTPLTSDPARELLRRQRLLDVYGALLTDRQREACRLHLDEDWSYTELAEHYGCSRSAAHDIVRRGLAQIDHFERVLGHSGAIAERDARIASLEAALAGAGGPTV
jgi:predicted DNA-binding protein YlxM (UPF0122 family)